MDQISSRSSIAWATSGTHLVFAIVNISAIEELRIDERRNETDVLAESACLAGNASEKIT
jgi:hypothetical protein